MTSMQNYETRMSVGDFTFRITDHWPQNMDGGQRRKIEAKRPPYWSSQKAVVTAVLSMKVLWDIQEDDPNNVFLIKKNMW